MHSILGKKTSQKEKQFYKQTNTNIPYVLDRVKKNFLHQGNSLQFQIKMFMKVWRFIRNSTNGNIIAFEPYDKYILNENICDWKV